MRKFLIGALLAATAVSPALADKGGKGGGKHGGGDKHAATAQHGGGGGGGKHAFRGGGAPQNVYVERAPSIRDRGDWRRGARFEQPVRVVRYDDKHERKAWKQAAKQERRWVKDEVKFARAVSRERYRPAERWVAPPTRSYERAVYYAPVRYATPVRFLPTARAWAYPVQSGWQDNSYGYDTTPLSYGYYDDDSYAGWPQNYGSAWPSNYASQSSDYGSGGLLGGGNGLLGSLLPVLLQSVLGGGGSLGGLGGLTGLGGPSVLPLDQVGYADPYAGGGDISSLLLPSLLNSGGGLF